MTVNIASKHDEIVAFYTARSAQGRSLLETWESGEAKGDSITPSTFSPEYRSWMRELLAGALGEDTSASLLSLGCGNAAVEQLVAARGYDVLVTDLCDDAVKLARRKGLAAVQAEVMTYEPTERYDVIYLDGLLGHLYDGEGSLTRVFDRIRGWLKPGGAVVASNDAPKLDVDVEAAPGVVSFCWLSADLIGGEAAAGGLTEVVSTVFRYERPISGTRERAVVIARAEA